LLGLLPEKLGGTGDVVSRDSHAFANRVHEPSAGFVHPLDVVDGLFDANDVVHEGERYGFHVADACVVVRRVSIFCRPAKTGIKGVQQGW
jgi:hypothetical protein